MPKFSRSTVDMLGFSTVAGGVGSAAMGGNFWQGAVNGLMVGALNHLKHKGQVERYSKREGKKFRDELWQSATEQKKEMIGYQLEDDSYFAYYDERNDSHTAYHYSGVSQDANGNPTLTYRTGWGGTKTQIIKGMYHPHLFEMSNYGVSSADCKNYDYFKGQMYIIYLGKTLKIKLIRK